VIHHCLNLSVRGPGSTSWSLFNWSSTYLNVIKLVTILVSACCIPIHLLHLCDRRLRRSGVHLRIGLDSWCLLGRLSSDKIVPRVTHAKLLSRRHYEILSLTRFVRPTHSAVQSSNLRKWLRPFNVTSVHSMSLTRWLLIHSQSRLRLSIALVSVLH